SHAKQKEYGKGGRGAQHRINMEPLKQLVGEVSAQHHKTGVGEVHHFHHAVDDSHAYRHGSVDAGQQQRRNKWIEKIYKAHRKAVPVKLGSPDQNPFNQRGHEGTRRKPKPKLTAHSLRSVQAPVAKKAQRVQEAGPRFARKSTISKHLVAQRNTKVY